MIRVSWVRGEQERSFYQDKAKLGYAIHVNEQRSTRWDRDCLAKLWRGIVAPSQGIRPVGNVPKSVALIGSQTLTCHIDDKRWVFLVTRSCSSRAFNLIWSDRVNGTRNFIDRYAGCAVDEICARDGNLLISLNSSVAWRDSCYRRSFYT